MKRLCIVLIVILTLGTAVFAADQGVDNSTKTIKIGWFGPLSGLFQKIGEGMTDGMNAYFDRLNSKGGIGGYKIKLIAYDNNNDPVMSKQIVKKLIKEDRVFAIVGALGSKGINAVISDIRSYGIPTVYLGGGEYHWAVPPKRNIFPVQPDYITEGRLLVKFALLNLKAKRVAFIYRTADNTGTTALKGAKIAMRQYGRRLGARFVLIAKNENFSSLTASLKKQNPEAVIVFDFFGSAAAIIKTAKKAGIVCNWITTYVNGDSIIYRIAGKYWLGVYIANWQKATTNNMYDFVRYFKTTKYYRKAIAKRWDAPSGYNIAGWVASEIFVGGLKLYLKKYGRISNMTWIKYINSLETMRNYNDTLANNISYYSLNSARPGSRNYYLARRGQTTLYFMKASLTSSGKFHLKPVTNWVR
jgi:branched-chain amino acid transport system substrate-binding protein